MMNLDTEDGWFATVYARYIQSERHARVVNEFAYVLRQIIKNPWGHKKYIALWKTFIITILPAVIPVFTSLAGPFCQLLHWIHDWFDEDPTLYFLLMWTQTFALTTIVIIGVEVYCHDAATRVTNTHLYQRPNMSMKDTLLPLPLSFFCLWIYLVVPFGVASIRSILPNSVANKNYVVAKKAMQK